MTDETVRSHRFCSPQFLCPKGPRLKFSVLRLRPSGLIHHLMQGMGELTHSGHALSPDKSRKEENEFARDKTDTMNLTHRGRKSCNT
jgi:hypothetical protein